MCDWMLCRRGAVCDDERVRACVVVARAAGRDSDVHELELELGLGCSVEDRAVNSGFCESASDDRVRAEPIVDERDDV